MYYIYVLKSEKDGKLYVGRTTDLRRRYSEHVQGQDFSTKGRRPLLLVYYEAYTDKSKWAQQELFYKSGIGREALSHKV